MVQTTDTENKGKNGLGIWYITLNCDNKKHTHCPFECKKVD